MYAGFAPTCPGYSTRGSPLPVPAAQVEYYSARLGETGVAREEPVVVLPRLEVRDPENPADDGDDGAVTDLVAAAGGVAGLAVRDMMRYRVGTTVHVPSDSRISGRAPDRREVHQEVFG